LGEQIKKTINNSKGITIDIVTIDFGNSEPKHVNK
jgi:hypothetical protein